MTVASGSMREFGVPATCEHKFCPDGGLMSSAGMKTKATGFMLQALLRPLGS